MPARGQTPSQTVGPFYAMALAREDGERVLVPPEAQGRIRITGRLLDGAGAPVEDGLLEIWQANAAGRYRHPRDDRTALALDDGFTGFGRAKTSFDDGTFEFETVKPGRVPAPDGRLQAPHVNVIVQARGMLNPAFTRIYFADEGAANDDDPVLRAVPEERRHTLVAARDDATQVPTYHLDIRLQGEDETVFLDV